LVAMSTVAWPAWNWQIGKNAKIVKAMPACTSSKSPLNGPTPVPISQLANDGAHASRTSLCPNEFNPRPMTLTQVKTIKAVNISPPMTAIDRARVFTKLRRGHTPDAGRNLESAPAWCRRRAFRLLVFSNQRARCCDQTGAVVASIVCFNNPSINRCL